MSRDFEFASDQRVGAGRSWRGDAAFGEVLRAEYRKRLILLSYCLAGLYLVLSFLHPFFVAPREAAIPMAVCSAISTLLSLGVGLLLRREGNSGGVVHVFGFFLAAILIVNSALHLNLTQDPVQSTNLLLVLIGACGIFEGYRDWWGVVLLTWVAWFIGGPLAFSNPSWMHYGFMLFLGNVMSGFLLTLRIRHRRELELSRRELESKAQSVAASNIALTETERRLNEAQEIAQIGSWQFDCASREVWWSREVYRMLGWAENEPPPSFEQCCEFVQDEDRERFRSTLKALFSNGAEIEIEFKALVGRGEPAVLFLRGQAHEDEKGMVSRLSGTVQDVTERRRQETERETLETQLLGAQRMDALGTLAGGIAHDFNNILFSILGNAQLAEMDVPENHPARKSIDNIISASRRARDVVRQILTFSQRQEVSIEATELSKVVGEVLDLLRASLPPSIEIQTDFEPGCPPIAGDPSQIHQILVNLCSNALSAMEEQGGTLKIGVKQVWPDTPFLQQHPQLDAGACVRLRVEDTGVGMGEATLERMFDPFFTTKSSSGGTGLGLAVVHGIVKSHRGAISVRSKLGQGTVFELYFPLLEEDSVTEAPETATLQRGNGERILFVDDEVPVLRAVAALLSRLGYHVVECTNPLDCERLIKRFPNRFDLLLTDLRMREMLGTELAGRVSKMLPELPIVLITGHAQELDERDLKAFGISCLVQKPTTLENLSATLAQVLVESGADSAETDSAPLELKH